MKCCFKPIKDAPTILCKSCFKQCQLPNMVGQVKISFPIKCTLYLCNSFALFSFFPLLSFHWPIYVLELMWFGHQLLRMRPANFLVVIGMYFYFEREIANNKRLTSFASLIEVILARVQAPYNNTIYASISAVQGKNMKRGWYFVWFACCLVIVAKYIEIIN